MSQIKRQPTVNLKQPTKVNIGNGKSLRSGALHEPRGPLPTKPQLLALQRIQEKAAKRVKLGMQLYRAAEVHTVNQQSLLDSFKTEQQQLKEELEQDVAQSLQAYDQWVGKIDENLTTAIRNLEGRINQLQEQWNDSKERIDTMIHRSESLMDQSRVMVNSVNKVLENKTGVPQQVPPAAQQMDQANTDQTAKDPNTT